MGFFLHHTCPQWRPGMVKLGVSWLHEKTGWRGQEQAGALAAGASSNPHTLGTWLAAPEA